METNKEKQQQLQEQLNRIDETLTRRKSRIVIFSGKGGVGKTTVAVNLAYAFVNHHYKVGLLDADITGPNAPKMIGLQENTGLHKTQNFIEPQAKRGLKVISMAPLVPKDTPVIWRGPLRSGTIRQFLADVAWGNLDFLIADLPPGTGDEVLTVAQRMLPQMAIIVTTPQEVSLTDCRRAVNMAKRLKIEKIGVIENMSGFICPHCKKEIDVFGTGGGEKMAEEMGVFFLGCIPMEIETREGGDMGCPIVLANKECKTTRVFMDISESIVDLMLRESMCRHIENLKV